MAGAVANPRADQAVVMVRGLDVGDAKWWDWLGYKLFCTFDYGLGLDTGSENDFDNVFQDIGRFLLVHGPHALPLLQNEIGTHLICLAHQNVVPIQVLLLPVGDGETPRSVIQTWSDKRRAWVRSLESGVVSLDDDPAPFGPVVRIYHTTDADSEYRAIDLRTGLVQPQLGASDGMYEFVLAALPLPPELE